MPHESFFHEIQPIVSPEHFAIDEKRRRPERATADGLVDVGAQPILDVVALDERRIDFRLVEKPAQRFLLAEVLSMFPNRAKRRRMKRREAAVDLRGDRGAQQRIVLNGKCGIELRGKAVALCPSLKFRDVVIRLCPESRADPRCRWPS